MRLARLTALFIFGAATVQTGLNGESAPAGAPVPTRLSTPIGGARPATTLPGVLHPGSLRSASPLPAAETPNPLPSSPAALFAEVPLGSPVTLLGRRLGKPWFVARLPDASYWAYSFDNDHAWFVATVRGEKIECVQVVLKAHQSASLRDAYGVAIGAAQPSGLLPYKGRSFETALRRPASALRGAAIGAGGATSPSFYVIIHPKPSDVFATAALGGPTRFYGIDAKQRVERFGFSLGLVDLPAIVKWFQPDGMTPESPITAAMAGGNSAMARAAFMSKYHVAWWPCQGGAHWTPLVESGSSFAGTAEILVKVSCRTRPHDVRTMFFAASNQQPRPFDVDSRSNLELSGVSTISRGAAFAPRPNGTATPPGAVRFMDSANGLRFVSNSQNPEDMDIFVAYAQDPNEPLTEVDLYPVTPTQGPIAVASVKTRSPLQRARRVARPDGTQPGSFDPISCGVNQTYSKCVTPFNGNGQNCGQAGAQYGNPGDVGAYYVMSPVQCGIMGTSSASNMPTCQQCNRCDGHPFDVVTGALWYSNVDAVILGRFRGDFQLYSEGLHHGQETSSGLPA